MKKSQVDKLFAEEYSSYSDQINSKITEIQSIITEIKDATSKYSILKNNLSSMFVNKNFDDNDTLQVYELLSAIIRDINRLNKNLFDLIERKTK